MNLEWYWAAAALFGLSVFLMMMGIPVAIAFCAGNIIAAVMFMGGTNGIIQTINNGFGSMTTFALVPIPMVAPSDVFADADMLKSPHGKIENPFAPGTGARRRQ